jgi:hypothetical protein
MERAIAEQLMQTFLTMSASLNSATTLIAKIQSKDDQESLRRAIGNVMQSVYIDLMRPIIREYPDLDPDPRT